MSTSVIKRDPRTATDGKMLMRSSAYSLGTRLYITGVADDRVDGVGKGIHFKKEHSDSGFCDWVSWQFNDWVELGGGGMWYNGASFGDYVQFRMYAPATTITVNETNEGNCIIHPTYGILIPSETGTHDVDLETADQAIPLLTSGGFWNWSYPDTGCGTFEAAPNGNGNCNLLPAEYAIHTYVSDVHVLGDGFLSVTFPGVDPTRFLPQWKMAFRVYNTDGTHTIQLVWELEVARMNGAVIYT